MPVSPATAMRPLMPLDAASASPCERSPIANAAISVWCLISPPLGAAGGACKTRLQHARQPTCQVFRPQTSPFSREDAGLPITFDCGAQSKLRALENGRRFDAASSSPSVGLCGLEHPAAQRLAYATGSEPPAARSWARLQKTQ